MSGESGSQRLEGELAEALHGEMVPKFLATLDAAGNPNVVPIITLDAADPKTLVFAELFIWKTRSNLAANPRVAAAVVTEDLRGWLLKGRFRQFVESGPFVEQLNRKNLFRYNAYVGVRRAAILDLTEVTGSFRLSKLKAASEILPVKLWSHLAGGANGLDLPARVSEKFSQMEALKVLAYRGADGYPAIVPVLSLTPARGSDLVFGTRLFRQQLQPLQDGARVAAAVITMDAIAYQVKGTFLGSGWTPAGRVGRIKVEEVYSACPPLPGERIEMSSA